MKEIYYFTLGMKSFSVKIRKKIDLYICQVLRFPVWLKKSEIVRNND